MEDATLDQYDLPSPSDDAPALPGYSLSERLGAGAFGEVWAGVQTRTGLLVAVKLLHRNWESFREELGRLRALSEHPYILTLLDADLDHVPPYLVTPLLAGGSLDTVQAAPERKIQWIHQLAEALAFTHGKGVLHCDLKPSNVLLDGEGRARLADFGQAIGTTAARGTLGTLGYMAPEQAAGGPPGPCWDIYGLGATAYFLLNEKPPRLTAEHRLQLSESGTIQGRLEVYLRCLHEAPLEPPQADEELAAIVTRCLALDPSERYASVAELQADLQRRETRALREALQSARHQARSATSLRLVAEARSQSPELALLLAAAALEVSPEAAAETLIRELLPPAPLEGSAVTQLAWSQDRLAWTTQEGLLRWGDFEVKDRAYVVVRALSLCGQRLAVTTTENSVHVFNGSREVYTGHTRPVSACALTDELLATGSEDKTIRLYRGAEVQVLEGHEGTVRSLAFLPGHLLSAGSLKLRLWGLDGSSRQVVRAHDDVVLSVAVHGSTVASGCEDGTVRLWTFDGQKLTPGRVLRGHEGPITSLKFAPDGRELASVSHDRTARLWDLASGNAVVLRGVIRALAYSPDGTQLALGMQGVCFLTRDRADLVRQARHRDFTESEVQRFSLGVWAEQLPTDAVVSPAALRALAQEVLASEPERAAHYAERAGDIATLNLARFRLGLSLQGGPVIRQLALDPDVPAELLAGLPDPDPEQDALIRARQGDPTGLAGLDDTVLYALAEDGLNAGLLKVALLALDRLLVRHPEAGEPRALLSRLRTRQDVTTDLLELPFVTDTVPARLRQP